MREYGYTWRTGGAFGVRVHILHYILRLILTPFVDGRLDDRRSKGMTYLIS